MNIRNIWLKTYTDKTFRIALHLLFWLILLAFTSGIQIFPLQVRFVGISISAVAYYSLVYGILPLYFKRKLVIAIPVSIAYVIMAFIITQVFYSLLLSQYHSLMASQGFPSSLDIDPRHIDSNFATDALYFLLGVYTVVLFPPLIAKFFREIYKQQTKALTLEKENVLLELNFLKSQVNPHFLFNTLNNIQSFIVNNELERSVDLIGKLSGLMRFSLYETGKDLIPLSKELEIIQNYISLERVRCEDRATIEYRVTGEGEGYAIPPYILLPFVENAFKHGVDHSGKSSFVRIDIRIEHKSLLFTIQNSFEKNEQLQPSAEGLGLSNVQKRLDHYFKNEYQLQINKENGVFFVKLEIKHLKTPK